MRKRIFNIFVLFSHIMDKTTNSVRIKRFASYLLIGVFFISLVSCSEPVPMNWATSDEGYSLWCEVDTSLSYSWNGGNFANLINGKGILTITHQSGQTEGVSLDAYYGAFSKSNAINTSSDEYYIGNVTNGKYADFAVLVKGNDIYVGEFLEGKPSGELSLFRSGKLFYYGSWLQGSFNGEGTLYRADGSVKSGIWEKGTLISADVEIDTEVGRYEGSVSNSKPNGFGRLVYKNGTEYEGEWKDGAWEGIGQYIVQKDSIISEWINGKANGNTTVVSSDYKYEGEFVDDLPNGRGDLYNLNPNAQYIYAGEWSNGLRQGYGDALYPNGDSYYGEWGNDEYQGIGRYRYANGDVYDGEWEDNLPSGNGQYQSKSFKYGGEWLEGWIHGFGRMDFPNGDIYEGDFCEGKKCGQGLYQYANGNVYEGEFFEDKINGLGVFTFSDGNRYEGEFLNGKIHGNGTLYYAASTGIVTLTAYWDKPNALPSEASIVFPNGDCYEGTLLNGEPTQAGAWFTKDAATGEPEFVEKLSDVNDYYKRHRDTFNKIVVYASIALAVVEVGATVAGPLTGGATFLIAVGAHYANIAINVVDIGTAIGSASIDLAQAETEEDKKVAAMTLGTEVAVNAALMLLPKALKAGPIKKITSKLSSSATSVARRSIIKFSKKKAIAKVISVVKNKEKKVILAFEKTTIGGKYFRATGKPSYQYVTNKQYQTEIKIHPDKEYGYHPEAVGNGKVLGDNVLKFMTEKAKRRYNIERRVLGQWRAQFHHIIAGNKSNAAAEESRGILRKFKIDINDPRNAILLPVEPKSIMRGTMHGKHVNSYDEYVLNKLKQATNPEQCLEVIDDIKKELYKGQLQLLTKNRVNTALRTVTRKSMY